MATKVFISHASEDKVRFVTEFAQKLKGLGVDPWVDESKMLPGDRLVDKIFEGINEAKAIVIVLSKNSVIKPWVREEISAAFVKRISDSTKIVPVVIDECEVPSCLKSTLYERIHDITDYDASLHRVFEAVTGSSQPTQLGTPPKYARAEPIRIPNLTETDGVVFRAICDAAMEKGEETIDNMVLLKMLGDLQMNEEVFSESLEILEGRGYVQLTKINGVHIGLARPSRIGFDEYLRNTREDYAALFKIIALAIVNDDKREGRELVQAVKLPALVVNHVVRAFEAKHWIEAARYADTYPCSFVIHRILPEMKRWLRGDAS